MLQSQWKTIHRILNYQIASPSIIHVIARKLNKEKLKIILQISGCKATHSLSLTDRIFDHIFARLIAMYDGGLKKTQTEDLVQIKPFKHNVVQVSEKYLREIVVNYVCERAYMKHKQDSYQEDFYLAWRLTEHREPLLILLGGTSGTGKSTVSSALASRFGVSTVLSTDSIRHIIRNFLSKEDNAILFASTYEAGKFITSDEQLSDNRRIIKGYKMQCNIVQTYLEHVIERFQKANEIIIIEGVHLTPFFMLKIMKQYKRVLPFALCIQKESKHKERFAVRSKYMTLDPGNNKYIENFPKIRHIQKWFLEKADEYLIPKVDNSNIDRSIELIHQTIITYLKRLEQSIEVDQTEMKNALPIYEEFTKLNNSKNILTSKQLKEYMSSLVNKAEIYENFLNIVVTEEELKEQSQPIQQQFPPMKAKVSHMELLQKSVQKFMEKNQKNDHREQPVKKMGEGNYIVKGMNFDGNETHHLSDDEDQTRRYNTDENDFGFHQKNSLNHMIHKRALSMNNQMNIATKDSTEDINDMDVKDLDVKIEQQQVTKSVSCLNSPLDIKMIKSDQLAHSQTVFPNNDNGQENTIFKKVSFYSEAKQPTHINQNIIQRKKSIDEEESTPLCIDYKGILQHLSKHKRLFLSKKTTPQSLMFVKKMIVNYNNKYRSKHTNDRIRLIQNPNESYCLYKTTLQINKSKKQQDAEHSSEEESECISSLAPTGKNFPFSEKKLESDGDDTVHFFQENQDSDNEFFVEADDAFNSVEASDSSDNDPGMVIGDEEDSFELQQINEEEEFNFEEKR